MKIAFVGKGGSGKSTVAYRMCHHLTEAGFFVLAVDADHNMDLAYNLDPEFNGPFLGEAREEILKYEETEHIFKLNPVDTFTKKYTRKISAQMRLMVSGPHTEDVLEGKRCSHSLSSPLKKYFPKLELAPKEAVVVDEKAGSDGVGTGVLRGFDHVFVITEPTLHSVKAAHQIADILEYYRIPYSFVANKVRDEKVLEKLNLRKKLLWSFSLSASMADATLSLLKQEKEGFVVLSRLCTGSA